MEDKRLALEKRCINAAHRIAWRYWPMYLDQVKHPGYLQLYHKAYERLARKAGI